MIIYYTHDEIGKAKKRSASTSRAVPRLAVANESRTKRFFERGFLNI
jgi:hypothetical protein